MFYRSEFPIFERPDQGDPDRSIIKKNRFLMKSIGQFVFLWFPDDSVR